MWFPQLESRYDMQLPKVEATMARVEEPVLDSSLLIIASRSVATVDCEKDPISDGSIYAITAILGVGITLTFWKKMENFLHSSILWYGLL